MAKAVEGSGDDGSHDRVRALLGEVRDSRAEDAGQPLEALAPLLESAASRLCLRKEGGIPFLVRLLPTQPAATARLLQLCAERRAQLEVHEAGGTTALLRALRAAVPLSATKKAVADVRSGEGDSILAEQLALLTMTMRHPEVREAVRAVAGSEGAYERLVALLDDGPLGTAGSLWNELHMSTASLVTALAYGGRCKGLAALAPQLSTALVTRLASSGSRVDVRVACATAIGNLSTTAAMRPQLVAAGPAPAGANVVKASADSVLSRMP